MIAQKFKMSDVKATETQVYVCSTGGQLVERMEICKLLWDADIKAEFSMKTNPKIVKDLSLCEKKGIPFAVIIKPEEYGKGTVNVKKLDGQTQDVVMKDNMVAHIKDLLEKQPVGSGWNSLISNFDN
jgi:histidyl-tRNA synthetase